ncbi:MAG TPA: hypothetical protein VKT82_28655 [Ktedonobacterales bacterium]|nr:hypothetical protein [Ktedonobacterales bacterium]
MTRTAAFQAANAAPAQTLRAHSTRRAHAGGESAQADLVAERP